ncbi:MAG: hypothetical protein PHH14_01645 [Candidatus Margulisbacteria bacterium]|nr:hypothetical protein [Candidatus Margulisiibacteriota bacterium]
MIRWTTLKETLALNQSAKYLRPLARALPLHQLQPDSDNWFSTTETIVLSSQAMDILCSDPAIMVSLSKKMNRERFLDSGQAIVGGQRRLRLDNTNEVIRLYADSELVPVPGKKEPVLIPVTRRDRAMVPILSAFQSLKEELAEKNGYKYSFNGQLYNEQLTYAEDTPNYFFRSSDPFSFYELACLLNQQYHLSGYFGFEPGAGLGQISAVLALFCSRVWMIEANPQLFKLAGSLFAALPQEIRMRIEPHLMDMNKADFQQLYLNRISRQKFLLYDYHWFLQKILKQAGLDISTGSMVAEVEEIRWRDFQKARHITSRNYEGTTYNVFRIGQRAGNC